MSTPKKPGTDLAALKARLAKKTRTGKAAPPAPPIGGPAAGGVPPAPPAAASLPPMAPPPGVDDGATRRFAGSADPSAHAPMAPMAPMPAMPQPDYSDPSGGYGGGDPYSASASGAGPAMAPTGGVDGDDPFGGGVGSFDPSEGMIDIGGDIKPKSQWGLTAFALALGVLFGSGVGWIGHKISSKGELIERGQAKGAKMFEAVQGIVEARKAVSLKMEDLKKEMESDPAGAAAGIEELLKDKFDSQARIDGLFGWELASVHAAGIKNTFKLFEEASRLKTDLGYLAAFLSSQSDALKGAGSGPSAFAIIHGKGAATLVGAVAPLCGESVENTDELAPCDNSREAIAYEVVQAVGGPSKVFARGTEPGEVLLLKNDGLYAYAIGMEPAKNALSMRELLVRRIDEHLEAMSKAEKAAVSALENYANDPNVDAPAPAPAE